ncbi:MAG: response regulator [Candidatus Saccharicenans sp.]
MSAIVAVIDDDRVTSAMLEKLFQEKGFMVVKAFDGETGWRLVKEIKPGLVICDMLLPKIHGADLCQKIKQDPDLKDTKVVLITAVYKGATSRLDIKGFGADHLFEKPVNTQELLSWVEKNVQIEKENKVPPAAEKILPVNIEAVDIDDFMNQLRSMITEDVGKKK